MKIIARLIVVAALIALGVWLWTVFFPSPQTIVRRRLARLANDISFTQNENNLVKIADARNVAGFFSDNVEVNITVPGHERQTMAGRDEIQAAALASRQQATELIVKFPDVNVTVAPGGKSVTADVTVDANVSGEQDAIVEELKITFEKIDGHWLITKVETVQGVS